MKPHRPKGSSEAAADTGPTHFYKAPEFCCAEGLADYRCQPLVAAAELRREVSVADVAADLGVVPAALEEPEVAHYTDRRRLNLCECEKYFYMYYRDPALPSCLACCKSSGRLHLLPKSALPRPVRATHASEFDAYLGRFEPRLPGCPWKLVLAASSEHVGHTGSGDSIRAVTGLQLLPLTWYRPMTRGRLDAVPPPPTPQSADVWEAAAGCGQFYADFEGHLKFHLAGVWAEEGAQCEHLGIECRHLVCCGSKAQLFYSTSGDVTRPLLQEPAEAGVKEPRQLRILSSVQEYLWNWFLIPDIGNLTDPELDRWLHPVVQGSVFSSVEKDESTGACCSLTLATRLGRSRAGLRPLRTGADEFGRAAGSRQCEQLLDWVGGGGSGSASRQRMAFVSHCAQLPLLMRRDFPLAGAGGQSPMSTKPPPLPLVELHPDSQRQASTVRRWLSNQLDRIARFGGGGSSPLPLLLLRPSVSPLGRLGRRKCPNTRQLVESVEAAFAELRSQLNHLSAEATNTAAVSVGPLLSDWSYLELPAADSGDDTVLATVVAGVGCLRLAGSGIKAASRQAFSVCLLDVETVESALPDLATLSQAMLVAQLRGHCSGGGMEASGTTRFIRGVLHLAEHAWQLARDSARLAETQLVTDRPARMIDDRASMQAKADAWMHLDMLTQLATDLVQRRPRGPETLLAACTLATWPAMNRWRGGYLHCGFVADGADETAAAGDNSAATESAEACFAWLVSVLERALEQDSVQPPSEPHQRQLLGSFTLAMPTVPATTAAATAADALFSVDRPLANLMKLTLRHGILLVAHRSCLHLVNLLCLWQLTASSASQSPELAATVTALTEAATSACPVAAVWTVPADELAGVGLRLTDLGGGGGSAGGGFLATLGLRSTLHTVIGAAPASISAGASWTGRRLVPRDQRWRSVGSDALRLVRLLEMLRPPGPRSAGLLRFRGAGAAAEAGGSAGQPHHPYERTDGLAVLRRALAETGASVRGPSNCLLANCLAAFLPAGNRKST